MANFDVIFGPISQRWKILYKFLSTNPDPDSDHLSLYHYLCKQMKSIGAIVFELRAQIDKKDTQLHYPRTPLGLRERE